MIKGSITALVTPFKNGKVDRAAFQDFVDWQIKSGTHGLVPCGTTGESATLSDKEHREVIALCVEAADGRVPVIAGAGSNETSVSVSYARHAKEEGADAALVVTPYYNKPNQEGIYQHFKAIAENVDIPIVVYNIPGRSVVDITNDTMGRLSKLPTVIGCKDATGDVTRVQAALLKGRHAEARQLNSKLDRLHKDLFLCPSPAPAKYALSLLGKMETTVRLPIVPCSDSTKHAVESAMKRAGIDF